MPRRGALTRLARPLSPRVVGQVAAVQAGGRSGSAQSHATDTTTDGERSGPRPALRVGRGEAPVGAAAATATAAAAEPFPRLARHPPSTGRQPATVAARDDKRGRRHLVEARRPGRWPRRRVAAQPRATRRRSSRRQRFGSPPSSKPQRAEHARWGGAGDPPAGAADGLLKPRRAMGERGPVAGASPNMWDEACRIPHSSELHDVCKKKKAKDSRWPSSVSPLPTSPLPPPPPLARSPWPR